MIIKKRNLIKWVWIFDRYCARSLYNVLSYLFSSGEGVAWLPVPVWGHWRTLCGPPLLALLDIPPLHMKDWRCILPTKTQKEVTYSDTYTIINNTFCWCHGDHQPSKDKLIIMRQQCSYKISSKSSENTTPFIISWANSNIWFSPTTLLMITVYTHFLYFFFYTIYNKEHSRLSLCLLISPIKE